MQSEFGELPIPGGLHRLSHASLPEDLNIIADSAQGCYINTSDGRRYLDYIMGSGPLIVGHAHPRVVQAIQDQAEKGTHYIVGNDQSIKLAKRLVNAVPCAEKVLFTNTGTQSTFISTRLARAFTGKDKIMKFEGALHGYHEYAVKSTNKSSPEELTNYQYPDGPVDSAGVVPQAAESVLIAPFNNLTKTKQLIQENSDSLAAVIVEPLQRALPPVEGFLSGLKDVCKENNVVLIFDEVVTGFRLSWGGGQEYYGVTPDIAAYGKTISGGTPLGAICGKEEIMEMGNPKLAKEKGGAWISSTLNGNPLTAAAANATLDILKKSDTYSNMNRYGDEFRSLINDLFKDFEINGITLGDGGVIDYAIMSQPVEDEITDWRQLKLAERPDIKLKIDRELVNHGILQKHGGKRYISTEHKDSELDKTREAYKETFEKLEL